MSYIIVVVLVIFGLAGIRIADQYERGVVFRLGSYHTTGPGVYWIIPLIEWQRRVDLRTKTTAVEQQETITKDNVPIKVNAVIWQRVSIRRASVIEVPDIDNAVMQVAAHHAAHHHRPAYARRCAEGAGGHRATCMQGKIDAVTEPWGVKVERVQMKNVEIPPTMQRAMAQEAEALREKRARHDQGRGRARGGRAAARGRRDHHAESRRARDCAACR